MIHGKSDGRPERPTGDLGPFTVTKTDTTNIKGTVAFEGDAKPNAALSTWGGVSRAKKNSSIEAHGPATIPK